MTSVYKATSRHEARMPFSLTNTVNIIAAIANRNDTLSRIGEAPSSGPKRRGSVVQVSTHVVAAIFGQNIAFRYFETMSNPAVQDFFDKLDTRLLSVGIAVSRGKYFWTISKFPLNPDGTVSDEYTYSLEDLCKQSPNGVILQLTPITQPRPSEHSIVSGTQYVTITLRK